MRLLLIGALLTFLFPWTTCAHPGKTDRHGGHRCWKDCGEWDLNYKEYHLHDEDYRPIRIEERKTEIPSSPAPQGPEVAWGTPVNAPVKENAAPQPKDEVVHERRYVTVVHEESIFPVSPLYLVLAALLLLLLLVLVRVTKNRQG